MILKRTHINNEKLLKLGLQNGMIVTIDEVANGLKCNCICPSCGQKLVAKNNPNNKKAAHFAHLGDYECSAAIETAIHKLAKQILKEEKTLFIPIYTETVPKAISSNKVKTYIKEQVVSFEDVDIEKKIPSGEEYFVADAVGNFKNRELIIEFAKTHFIDETKKLKIQKTSYACVEIDISTIEQEKEAVRKVLVTGLDRIKWIQNPHAKAMFQKDLADYKRQKAEETERLKIKKEQEQLAIDARLRDYKIKKYLFIKRKKGNYFYCPAMKFIKAGFAETIYGKHEVIQLILNGNKWNGKFYGGYLDSLSEKHIYVGDKRIEVYPIIMDDKDRRKSDFLYKCLMKYKAYKKLISDEPCKYCSFFRERIYGETVCSFNNNVVHGERQFYDYEAMEFIRKEL